MVPCWERADLSALVCDVLLCVCHFSISVYPRNKKGHGNFIKKGYFKRALSDQKGHSKRALSDQKGHINLAISVVALLA